MTYRVWQKIFNKLDRDIVNRQGLKEEWKKVLPAVKMQICNEWWRIIKETQNEEVVGHQVAGDGQVNS